MKISNIKAGMTLYSVRKYKMGNTTMSTVGVWTVYIVSVEESSGVVVARWNGNGERRYRSNTWSKWREKEPILISCGIGHRLANREEIAAHKAAKSEITPS